MLYWKGAKMKKKKKEFLNLETFRLTGVPSIDSQYEYGFPVSKTINIYGEEMVGKTRTALKICETTIREYNKKVYYFNVDGGITIEMLSSMGLVDLLYDKKENPEGKLYILNMSFIGDIFCLMNLVTKDQETGLVVIDTDAGIINEDPENRLKKRLGGHKAKTWSNYTQKIIAMFKYSNASLIIISQMRYSYKGFHPQLVSTANRSIKYISNHSLRILKDGEIQKIR